MIKYNNLRKEYKQYNKILGIMKSIYEIEKDESIKEYISYVAGLKNGIKYSLNEFR